MDDTEYRLRRGLAPFSDLPNHHLISVDGVQKWANFEAKGEKTIKPVNEWAAMFSGARLFQRRLDDDFVEKNEGYGNEALSALGEALA